ncbi:uncharacterized protein LOC100185285 [Ciona intestinalis]
MDFVVTSIQQVTEGNRNEPLPGDITVSTENEFRSNTPQQSWSFSSYFPKCGMNSRYFCTCGLGVALLLAGSCCLILYFVQSRLLLIPALALFIVGIVVSSIGEWYCRIKIRHRQVQARRERERISDEDCERVAQAVQRQIAAQAAANDQPPAYFTLAALPTVSSLSNDAYVTDEEDAPPYTAYDVTKDVLPSYSEATNKLHKQ